MLADTTSSYVNATEKAGDWPPLLSLMTGNSSIEQLQSDIVDWFRENRPDAFEIAAQSGEDRGACDARPQHAAAERRGVDCDSCCSGGCWCRRHEQWGLLLVTSLLASLNPAGILCVDT